MSEQKFEIEIDRSAISDDAFALIKNDLVRELVKDAWTPDLDDTTAWHVKAEFEKHVKGGISVSGHEAPGDWGFDPDVFDPTSPKIERLTVSIADPLG